MKNITETNTIKTFYNIGKGNTTLQFNIEENCNDITHLRLDLTEISDELESIDDSEILIDIEELSSMSYATTVALIGVNRNINIVIIRLKHGVEKLYFNFDKSENNTLANIMHKICKQLSQYELKEVTVEYDTLA